MSVSMLMAPLNDVMAKFIHAILSVLSVPQKMAAD